jgi:hypothetical protein
LTNEEIVSLALTLQACTPLAALSSMEARTVLEVLRGRGYLRRPVEPWTCTTCRATATKETTTQQEKIR